MSSVTLVLETSWAWDHFHTGYATIGLEDHGDAETLKHLTETGMPDELLLKKLQEICDAQDRSIMAKPRRTWFGSIS